MKTSKKLIEAVEAAGWTVERTRNNHLRFIAPPGTTDTAGRPVHVVVMSSTPSDYRATRNAIAFLRRCGVEIDRSAR